MKPFLRASPLVLVLVLACGRPSAAPPLVLGKLGLVMDAPGCTVGDGVAGGALVEGQEMMLTVDVATAEYPRTAEAAVGEVEMFNPEAVEKEALADGFVLRFETQGDVGRNYFVQVRRALGETAYWCEATVTTPALAEAALAACKSLRRR